MRAEIEKQHGVRTMYCGANLAHALEIERDDRREPGSFRRDRYFGE